MPNADKLTANDFFVKILNGSYYSNGTSNGFGLTIPGITWTYNASTKQLTINAAYLSVQDIYGYTWEGRAWYNYDVYLIA